MRRMVEQILRCTKCRIYTLERKCTKCNSECLTTKPAKYSPEDKYAKYRLEYKKKEQGLQNNTTKDI
ncbi:MAG: H/ACA ribonucleoprotein complex subunit 3 [archaeon GW2011_AR18]|nr:MAG: H/ACA ribonucleoprotein complex subunit 3 [archaeon GW2011_AR18]